MKKLLGLVVIGLMLLSCGLVFASGGTSYTANASPVIVSLSGASTSASREITFPYTTRNLYIRNYDTGGVWVNLRGGDIDAGVTNAGANSGKRVYIGPSGSMDLLDFATNGITVFNDIFITNNSSASPVVVLATY